MTRKEQILRLLAHCQYPHTPREIGLCFGTSAVNAGNVMTRMVRDGLLQSKREGRRVSFWV